MSLSDSASHLIKCIQNRLKVPTRQESWRTSGTDGEIKIPSPCRESNPGVYSVVISLSELPLLNHRLRSYHIFQAIAIKTVFDIASFIY